MQVRISGAWTEKQWRRYKRECLVHVKKGLSRTSKGGSICSRYRRGYVMACTGWSIQVQEVVFSEGRIIWCRYDGEYLVQVQGYRRE